jgi:PAS domain S-box-containing protein
MIDGKHKGTMFAGQFIPEKSSPEQLQNLEKIAPEIDLDPGLLVKEAEKMRVVREDVIRNYSSLLFKIVETIARRCVQAAELSRVNDALQVAHDGLEKRVQERTSELAEANKGLEQEVAERKIAEEELRESEEKYRMLYDSSKDAIMTLTPEEGFLSGNPAVVEIFGCKGEKEFISQTPHDLSPPYQPDGALSSEKAEQMMAIAMEKGSHFFEWTHKRMDSQEFPATVLLTRMELQGRRILQATVRDITEWKAAEEELQKRAEELEEFNKLAVGRELKMIELKKEINALLEKSGKEPGYKIVGDA